MHWWQRALRQSPAAPANPVPAAAPGEPPAEILARSDDVVQQLTVAKYALAGGDADTAAAAVDAALTSSRRVLTSLVQRDSGMDGRTDLTRADPATSIVLPADPTSGMPRPRR